MSTTSKVAMFSKVNSVATLLQVQLVAFNLTRQEVALLRVRLAEILDAMEDEANG